MQWDGSIAGGILIATPHANGLGILAIAFRLRVTFAIQRLRTRAPANKQYHCGDELILPSGYRRRSVSLSPMLACHVRALGDSVWR